MSASKLTRRYDLRKRKPDVSSTIHGLTPELIAICCKSLHAKDMKALRLTCKDLLAKSMYSFGKRLFNHLVVYLHPVSLNHLYEMASHEGLSGHVQTVSVALERLYPKPLPLTRAARPPLVSELIESQKSMENSGLDISMLAESFRKLTNLKKVQVICKGLVKGDMPPRLLLCGKRLTQTDAIKPYLREPDPMTGSRVYETIMQALERNGEQQVDVKLYLEADEDDQSLQPFTNTASRAARLTALNMSVPLREGWYLDLLLSAHALNTLKIKFIGPTMWPLQNSTDVLQTYASLTKLKLSDGIFDHDILVSFLQAHSNTLTVVHLSRSRIYGHTWKQPLLAVGAMPNLTGIYFRDLGSDVPSSVIGPSSPTLNRLRANETDSAITRRYVAAITNNFTTVPNLSRNRYFVDFRHANRIRRREGTARERRLKVEGKKKR